MKPTIVIHTHTQEGVKAYSDQDISYLRELTDLLNRAEGVHDPRVFKQDTTRLVLKMSLTAQMYATNIMTLRLTIPEKHINFKCDV